MDLEAATKESLAMAQAEGVVSSLADEAALGSSLAIDG